MATYISYDQAIEDTFEGLHDFKNDTYNIVLSDTAPTVATDNALADAAEISSGNGYTAGGEAVAITSADQVAGVLSVIPTADLTVTASGGSIGPFRYAILINDTADLLLNYWDRGSSVTLLDGESVDINFGATIFTATSAT